MRSRLGRVIEVETRPQGGVHPVLATAERGGDLTVDARALPWQGSNPIELLASSGVPVMAHLGLTPQSVHSFGGYKVQGRGEDGVKLLQDAKALQAAGAFAVVLEVVPADLAAAVSASLEIPTIGIGAGGGTDAQVIVWQDMAGLTPGRTAKFDVGGVLRDAAQSWAADVVSGAYPATEHTYE